MVYQDEPLIHPPGRDDMTDLRSILEAFPAGTKLLVVAAELPEDTRNSRGRAAEGNALPQAALQIADAALDSSGQSTPLDELLLTRLQQLRERRGNIALKPKEWSATTGISVRELRRAICAGAVMHEAKEDGRDHGAKLITADAMLAFLATVFAVERGRLSAPEWWTEVRGKRATAA